LLLHRRATRTRALPCWCSSSNSSSAIGSKTIQPREQNPSPQRKTKKLLWQWYTLS
jgi:hypothetical protein